MINKKCSICNKIFDIKKFNLKYTFSKRKEEQVNNLHNTVDWCRYCTHKKPTKEYCIHAMARSGHHAIMTWICNQLVGRTCMSRDILMSKRLQGRLKTNKKLRTEKFDNHIYTIEDKKVKMAEKMLRTRKVQKTWNLTKNRNKVTTILALRDPWNIFASRIALVKKLKKSSWDPLMIGEWKEHAREFLGITSFLNNPICINYNLWFQDKDYRKQLSSNLGVAFRDDGLQGMMKSSSFDGLKYHGKAQNMDVLHRWKKVKLPMIFNDDELYELSESIFGDISPPYLRGNK